MAEPGTTAGDLVAEAHFSGDELRVLAAILDVPFPPGLSSSPSATGSSVEQARAADTAARSLIAHGVLSVTPEGLVMPDVVERIVRVAATPTVRAAVAVARGSAPAELRYCAASVDTAVEHRGDGFDTQVLEPFQPARFVGRVAAIAGWPEGAALDAAPVAVSMEALPAFLQAAAEQADDDAPGGEDVLRRAIRETQASGSVVIARRESESTIEGKTFGWIDAGDRGLWLVTPPIVEGDVRRIRFEPVSGAQLIGQLEDAMPSGWPDTTAGQET